MLKKNKFEICILVLAAVVYMLVIAMINMLYLSQWQINKIIAQTNEKTAEEILEPYKNIPIKAKYNIVMRSRQGAGELTLMYNFAKAAQKLGWQASIIDEALDDEQQIAQIDPDFIIIFGTNETPITKIKRNTKYKKYIFFDGAHGLDNHIQYNYFTQKLEIKKHYENLFGNADGILCLVKNIELIKNAMSKINDDFQAIPFYTYSTKTDYKPMEAKRIVTIGSNWDQLRNSERYRQFFQMLSKDNLVEVYGPKKSWEYIKDSWKGFVKPKDITQVIQENGIVLILHSDFHINHQQLTIRIIEAVSAGAMVISDRNPAVIQNFGDNVLYIDHTASSEEIYKQIKSHCEWIKSHPKEVQAMTKRNHEIFLEKFTAEAGMINVAKMHEYMLMNKKSDNDKLQNN
jgi:hypothetical protein